MKEIERIFKKALYKVYLNHENLGNKGEEIIKNYRFREETLLADWEAEKVVINTLREERFPAEIVSEEHGVVILDNNAKYLVLIDGIDGTRVFKESDGRGRYGTIISVFETTNPKYEDSLFGGIVEHSTNRLFYGLKGKGSFLEFLRTGNKEKIHCSGVKKLRNTRRIYIDESFEINKRIFSDNLDNFNTLCLWASAAHYIDTALGVSDLALECTRKGNLEIASSYRLIKEAGGVMVDLHGNSLESERYLNWGQIETIPVITAATKELAKDLIQHIKSRRELSSSFFYFSGNI